MTWDIRRLIKNTSQVLKSEARALKKVGGFTKKIPVLREVTNVTLQTVAIPFEATGNIVGGVSDGVNFVFGEPEPTEIVQRDGRFRTKVEWIDELGRREFRNQDIL